MLQTGELPEISFALVISLGLLNWIMSFAIEKSSDEYDTDGEWALQIILLPLLIKIIGFATEQGREMCDIDIFNYGQGILSWLFVTWL